MDQAIECVQFAYPQIYYACHTRHERKRSSASRLSRRDSEILVHLDRTTPTTLSSLARHMDLAASTMSEAVSKLERYGYLLKVAPAGPDRRRVGILLTPQGVQAVRAESVLERRRLAVVLARLSPAERTEAVAGLSRLARACRTPDADTPQEK